MTHKKKISPQAAKLADILTNTSGITPVLALTVYHIGSLSKRISELRSAGYVIERKDKHDGFGRSYSEYVLVKTPHESNSPSKKPFLCPLGVEDCYENCGSYSCGN